MKTKYLGKTKTNSSQYAVFNSLNMVVAIYFKDDETDCIYRISIIDDGAGTVKEIMRYIENEHIN